MRMRNCCQVPTVKLLEAVEKLKRFALQEGNGDLYNHTMGVMDKFHLELAASKKNNPNYQNNNFF